MSECFAHDIAVRNSWVPMLSERATKRIGAIEKNARFALYHEVDKAIKVKYVETLREANKDPLVLHVKGLGMIRRSKDQLNLDQVLAEAAHVVVHEYFGDW